jgi:hypothetical protein
VNIAPASVSSNSLKLDGSTQVLESDHAGQPGNPASSLLRSFAPHDGLVVVQVDSQLRISAKAPRDIG